MTPSPSKDESQGDELRRLAKQLELEEQTGLDGKPIFSYLDGQGDQEWHVEVPEWLLQDIRTLIDREKEALLRDLADRGELHHSVLDYRLEEFLTQKRQMPERRGYESPCSL
jgi:hypothetical protein